MLREVVWQFGCDSIHASSHFEIRENMTGDLGDDSTSRIREVRYFDELLTHCCRVAGGMMVGVKEWSSVSSLSGKEGKKA